MWWWLIWHEDLSELWLDHQKICRLHTQSEASRVLWLHRRLHKDVPLDDDQRKPSTISWCSSLTHFIRVKGTYWMQKAKENSRSSQQYSKSDLSQKESKKQWNENSKVLEYHPIHSRRQILPRPSHSSHWNLYDSFTIVCCESIRRWIWWRHHFLHKLTSQKVKKRQFTNSERCFPILTSVPWKVQLYARPTPWVSKPLHDVQQSEWSRNRLHSWVIAKYIDRHQHGKVFNLPSYTKKQSSRWWNRVRLWWSSSVVVNLPKSEWFASLGSTRENNPRDCSSKTERAKQKSNKNFEKTVDPCYIEFHVAKYKRYSWSSQFMYITW